MSLPVYLDI